MVRLPLAVPGIGISLPRREFVFAAACSIVDEAGIRFSSNKKEKEK